VLGVRTAPGRRYCPKDSTRAPVLAPFPAKGASRSGKRDHSHLAFLSVFFPARFGKPNAHCLLAAEKGRRWLAGWITLRTSVLRLLRAQSAWVARKSALFDSVPPPAALPFDGKKGPRPKPGPSLSRHALRYNCPAALSGWVGSYSGLQTAANIFDLLYTGEGIKIEYAMAHRSPRPNE
jgi:hypothetical protein